jgi:hypothetical protein
MTADLDMSSEDAATRKKGIAFLQDVVRVVVDQEIGCDDALVAAENEVRVGDEREVLVHPLVFSQASSSPPLITSTRHVIRVSTTGTRCADAF